MRMTLEFKAFSNHCLRINCHYHASHETSGHTSKEVQPPVSDVPTHAGFHENHDPYLLRLVGKIKTLWRRWITPITVWSEIFMNTNPLITFLVSVSHTVTVQAADPLRVLNWSDYIDEDLLLSFTNSTGIDLDYQTFEDEEEFISAFFDTEKAWDVIVPSDNLLAFLISKNALQPLRKDRINFYDQFDPRIMAQLATKDPENTYAVPYMWGTTGLGINWTAAQALGVTRRNYHDWSVVFDDTLRSQFSDCGIAAVNEPDEIFAAALRYAGFSINTTEKTELATASELVKRLARDVRYFHSGRYTEDLANGNVCLVVGYSGDIMGAAYEADEQDIDYFVPSQGSSIWFDVLAIPANAANTEGAHAFIDYLSTPEVAAANTNYNAYPNPILSSAQWVEHSILNNPGVYPTTQTIALLEGFAVQDKRTRRLKKKYWVYANCGAGAYCEVPISLYGYF